jgi:hypothetical protein
VPKHAPIAEAADYEAILGRLRAEVDRGTDVESDDRADGFSLRRDQAERGWSVTAERPFLYRAGVWGRVRGLLLVPAKVFLRKLMRWYVEPLAYDQRSFNAAALRLLDDLQEQVDRLEAELAMLRNEKR